MGDNSVFERQNGSIEIRSLDSFNLQQIDFAKIDIQGAEIAFLQGAEETIKRCRPILVIEAEEHTLCRYGFNTAQMFEKLKSLDYVLLLVEYEYPSDYLCIPKENFGSFWQQYSQYIKPSNGPNHINSGWQCGIRFSINFSN